MYEHARNWLHLKQTERQLATQSADYTSHTAGVLGSHHHSL